MPFVPRTPRTCALSSLAACLDVNRLYKANLQSFLQPNAERGLLQLCSQLRIRVREDMHPSCCTWTSKKWCASALRKTACVFPHTRRLKLAPAFSHLLQKIHHIEPILATQEPLGLPAVQPTSSPAPVRSRPQPMQYRE